MTTYEISLVLYQRVNCGTVTVTAATEEEACSIAKKRAVEDYHDPCSGHRYYCNVYAVEPCNEEYEEYEDNIEWYE